MELYIESLSLVETLWPRSVFLFPYGDVGTLVKSLQFSFWMLWYCRFGNPDLWSSFHFYFSDLSNSKFSEAHISRGPVTSFWWPFTCLQNHVSEVF